MTVLYKSGLVQALIMAACLLLAACGDVQDEFGLLRRTLGSSGAEFNPRAAVLVATRPLPPRLEAGFPSRGLNGVMLLETERDGVQTWLSADGATLTLKQGFLTSTNGFGAGLAGSRLQQSTALVLAGHGGIATRFHSFLNGNDQIIQNAYECEISVLGRETVFLRGQPISARKLEERCYGVAENFTNTYWLRRDAPVVLQSSQWTGSFLGNLFMKAVPDDI